MKHKITIIGINFYPEDTAIGLYTTQLAEFLSKYYDVDVITGFPYYPKWEIEESYKDKPKYMKENLGDINIFRYKQYVPKNPTFKKRVLHLLDFTLGNIPNIFKIKQSDLVICIIPPTGSVILGLILSKLKKSKLWIHIQDFEFDAAFESGIMSKESKVFKVLFSLERFLLKKADIVSTISYGMLKKLKEKIDSDGYYLPNWIDEDFINPEKAKTHRYMNSKKFKVLYSGNIGEKQDWETFLKVVNVYKDNPNIEFIVVGAGAKKDWLVEKTKNIKNVKHYMPVKYEELPDLLCSADLHILFQKEDVVDTVMPSKILGMMASQKPSIVTGNKNSEVAKIFNESKGGFYISSKLIDDITNSINLIMNNQDISKEMGQNARNYIINHFAKEKVLSNLKNQIEKMLEK